MLKKMLSVVLILILVFSLSGCSKNDTVEQGKQDNETPEQITITFGTSVYVEAPHKKAIDLLIDEYNKKNPNIKIEVYGSNYDNFWDNLTTEILANNEGDIIQMYPENIGRYHALRPGGTFESLDKFIKGTELETDLTGQEFCKYDDEYVALSNYASGTTAIFYRKSIFEEAGINPEDIKTLEDLRKAAIKLKNDDRYGISFVIGAHPFGVSEWSRLVARPVSKGIYFPNNESGPYTAENINCNSPENIWAAEWWQNVYLKDKAARSVHNKKETRELFWNGNVAMSLDGPWFIGMTRERDKALLDDLGIIPQPIVEFNNEQYKPNPTMYSLVTLLSKNCKHKEEAWEFMKWMASPEAQKLIEESGMIPSSKSFVEESDYKSRNELAYKMYEYAEEYYADVLVADPAIAQQGELQQIMIDATQEIFAAGKNAKAVLDSAAEKMKEVMNR